jgi:hypothetical protein
VLRIGRHVVAHAQGVARRAGLAFADHRERGRDGCLDHLDLRLETHRVGQLALQRRHVDDPGQGVDPLLRGIEAHLAAVVAMHPHPADRRGMRRIGPGAQRFEQCLGRRVERIGTHVVVGVAGGRRRRRHQRHAHAFARQEQCQGAADDAAAANANLGG